MAACGKQILAIELPLIRAEVAELADAQDLGSCGRKAVGVQLPPSAPKAKFIVHAVQSSAFGHS